MRYLLCRPRGGINDTLNQIELCWRYARSYNRILVVDTEYLVSSGICISFSELFETHKNLDTVRLKLTSTLLDELNHLSTFPLNLRGRLDKYQIIQSNDARLVDKDYRFPLTFDFNINYSEDLLVHDQFGGNIYGIHCLARLKFTPKFKTDVLNMISPLIGKAYLSLHIRHTDYQTDYIRAFKEIYNQTINQRLLVCTDSVEVINFAKEFFYKSDVISLSLPPDTDGYGIPTYATFHCNHEQRYQLIVETFSDLIALAMSMRIIFCKLESGKFSDVASKHQDFLIYSSFIRNNPTRKIGISGLSGFSILAASLKNNPNIINQLFSDSDFYKCIPHF